MKVLGIIPARYKSSRFPGKPLELIAGKPLVQRVYERASKCRDLDSLCVATEDERIESFCRTLGIPVVMTSDRHPTGTDRLAEVARRVKADLYVNIQGDEPLIDPGSITAAIKGLLKSKPRTVTCLMKKISAPDEIQSVNVPKVVVNDQNKVVFFSRLPIPFAKGKVPSVHYKQVCVYAFTRNTLATFARLPQSRNERVEEIELLRLTDNGVPIQMVEVKRESIAVDVPGDIRRVEALLR